MSLRVKLGDAVDFFNRFSQLANCHLVNFITDDLWDTCVPEEMKREIEHVGMDRAMSFFWDINEGTKCDSTSNVLHLRKYVMEAYRMSTGSLSDICLSHSDISNKFVSWGTTSQAIPQLNQFMSPKKAHEVEIMSELVAALSKVTGSSHIVDIGSGKGYLTSLLALHHSLKVLGVDSSSINTHGATKRTQKLQVPIDPLWYRSLLQVLLVEKCRDNLPEGQVGRLAAKCKSFPEYVSKALTKLGVASEVSLNEVESLYMSHQSHQQKLSVFFMLRAVLAPVIETIILLDRLLYLHEQGIADAHLVQLFDPVTSPRCYAVLAIKQDKLGS